MMEFQLAIEFDSPRHHLLWTSQSISLAPGAQRRSVIIASLPQRHYLVVTRFIFLIDIALGLIKFLHLLQTS